MQWQSILDFMHRILRESNLHFDVDKKRNEHELMPLIMSNNDVKELLRSWLNKQNELKTSKCNRQAKSLKNDGNKLFKMKNYSSSVELYTNSARYASIDNGDYSISLANRSAALYHMNEYKRCLEDIDVAFASDYPKELRPKLHLRAAQCWIKLCDVIEANEQIIKAQNLITNNENITINDKGNILRHIDELKREIDELSNKNITKSSEKNIWCPDELLISNPMCPSASSVLKRNYSPICGRYITAKSPIKKGDVLYVEKPFALVTLDHITSNLICVHCCSYIANNIYPCRSCTHVTYCSKKCWIDSWSSYHKWECIGYEMHIWKQIGIAHLSLKVLFSSVETIDNIKFNNVQQLVTNIDKLPTDDLILYSITAMMLVQYLEYYTNFFSVIDIKKCLIDKFMDKKLNNFSDISRDDDKKLFIGGLLLRHLLQLIANGHAITRLNLSNTEGESVFEEHQQRVAVGIYPCVSMMNHSCDPNIMNTFWNDYLIVKAIKDIPTDGEIFNCYGPHFRRMGLKKRQDTLINQYCFTCKCESCTNPELQNFLDRFNALKCLKCNGTLIDTGLKSYKCLKCDAICNADGKKRQEDLNKAESLFNLAQDFMQSGQYYKSIEYYKNCLDMRKKWLFIYHDDITIIYDALGKMYAIMSEWYNSILYLEESICGVEEKFGPDSIEVANELNKITDICIKYLQQEANKKTLKYRNIEEKTQRYLERGEMIMRMIGGPWSDAYQDISNKKNELSDIIERICIK